MSLTADIKNVLKSLGDALPDATKELIHGTEVGKAIKSSSVEMTGEAATESGAIEKSRVIVDAEDFPSLGSDALIYLDDEPYIVTSLRTDPVGASMTVGLSAPLHGFTALYQGVRKSSRLNATVDILAEDNGIATEYGEGFAPTTVHSWTIVISHESWLEGTPPQIGDDLAFNGNHLKVSRLVEKDSVFIINARSR